MLFALILVPMSAAAIALAIPSNRWRPWILPPVAVAHLVLAISNLRHPASSAGGWLVADPVGGLVSLLLSGLFLLCSVYAVGYLRHHMELSNRIFVACLLMFLAVTTLVTCAHHLGLMWVAIEATTLSTAPLIYFDKTPRSIEATWKYLLIGSVGIAIALLGSFFLAYASLSSGGESSLLFEDLLHRAPLMDKSWLHAAFVLLLVGYGTKMGLAPMHTWLPDAHSEAPSPVSALLSGALINCAFLALVRVDHVCRAAGQAQYSGKLLIAIGLLSMLVAAIYMVGQSDFKRMLAYSSVEHMGILAVALGVGGPVVFAALLHMLNNGLTKGMLFLSAGNIVQAYGSKSVDDVRGAIRRLPLSGTLFLLGLFAITGSPPFGTFVSQFKILSGAIDKGHLAVGAIFLTLLFVTFVGMGRVVLPVTQGRPSAAARHSAFRDGLLSSAPIVAAFAVILLLGVHIPGPLVQLLNDAAHFLEVRS